MTQKTSVLEELRGRLLDLSLKNNLLNYHALAARTVEIVNEHVGEVYSLIVLKEKAMKFYPSAKASASPEEKNLWKYPIFTNSPLHTDLILNTPYTDIDLRKKLYTLQAKSRTVFEEQGYPILYLALGMLEWNDTVNKGLKAPLLLIPVNLNKQKIKENYTLSWSGEDPIISPSLAAKLAEAGITLPEFGHPETPQEIMGFFDTVTDLVSPNGWRLLPEIVLDLFSFKKYVMYKDLDDASWGGEITIESRPLVQSIFAPDTVDTPETALPLKSTDFANIMDADSSQLAVIAEARNGKNLVVEGPPGTGKSQTIANMIAEMLMAGKSVLFVSEKMAALQVVKRRLDAAGLSRFLLELHSQNAKKQDFLRELESCLQNPIQPDPSRSTLDNTQSKIVELSEELSGYCEELQTPIGECGFSPYDLFGIREEFRHSFEDLRNSCLPSVPIENAATITAEEYREAIAALSDIVSYLPTILEPGESLTTHPWIAARPGRILPGDRDEIRRLAVSFRDNIRRMNEIAQEIAITTDLPFIPKNEEGLPVFVDTCREIGKNLVLTDAVFTNPMWQNRIAIDSQIARYRAVSKLRGQVTEIFTPDITRKNTQEIYQEFLKESSKGTLGRMFSSTYKNLKAEIKSCLKNPAATDGEIIEGLKQVRIYAAEQETWAEQEPAVTALFAPVWAGDSTDPDMMQMYASWVLTLHTWLREGRITPGTIASIVAGKAQGASHLIAEIEMRFAEAKAAESALRERIGVAESTIEKDFIEMEAMADSWAEHIERLEGWSRFTAYLDRARATPAASTVGRILEGRLETDEIIPAFVVGYVDALLKETYQTRPRLAQFAQSPHEQKIETFKALDRMVIKENATRISRTLASRIPTLFGGAARESEMGILAGEFNRKRGHMAIRTLMTKAGGLIQKVKPCFMMSPLSVAQYLDPRSVTFDIIIFDEASQVKPEDALGALMRGRQLVVMGDSRQLPPTTFFDSVGANAEDGDEVAAEITDMESLLHACKQVYPTRRLTWHYRSRHESLIAVSNAEFYDGSLFVFPSPQHETPDLGLSFVHTEGTIYERGKSGANRDEAQIVAEAVISYYQRFPDKTLGVATFSVKQQERIRHEVDLLLRNHPDVEARMHATNGEDFFVKNLETVQGDERDTILISIGYGFDEEHKLSRNFGPLNQAGGERRLNVLITRARERCVVYANFRGYDLPLDTDTPRGVAALASFLIYAETRNTEGLGNAMPTNPVPDNFADTVAQMLEANGYAVTRDLGCAGFRIDIAISSPNDPGIFIAGILCDGPNYWSAADARDRDRLRSQVLDGLGWTLLRIWAPEWYCSPQTCTRKLLDQLTAVLASPKPVAVTPQETPLVVPQEDDESRWEELPETPEMPAINTGFAEYVPATGGVLANYHQFSSVQDPELSTAITEITLAEGPLSEKTLYARIKELGHVPRMTPAIKKRITNLADNLVTAGTLVRDEEGFYALAGIHPVARIHRTKWEIAEVSHAELLQASILLLARQHATPKQDLAKQMATVLGFKATPVARDRCMAAIDGGISIGRITEENGICTLPETP